LEGCKITPGESESKPKEIVTQKSDRKGYQPRAVGKRIWGKDTTWSPVIEVRWLNNPRTNSKSFLTEGKEQTNSNFKLEVEKLMVQVETKRQGKKLVGNREGNKNLVVFFPTTWLYPCQMCHRTRRNPNPKNSNLSIISSPIPRTD
jgi:hypothetical protein